MIRENPDGTRTQLDFFTMGEEDDAAYFIRRYNIQPPEWRRTGNVVCESCGQYYSSHRHAWPWRVLHRICSGEYVKL